MKSTLKRPLNILAAALAAALQLAAHAAVPLAWEVRPGDPAPAAFDRHHGETLEFRCAFRSFGELPFEPGADVRLWYQTNGMGQAWWSAPATVQSNVITATWSPALDPGADRVSLFFGAPSNVYASAVLRLRHSPGFTPSELTLPVQRLDFAAVEVANAPYYTKGEVESKIAELAPAPGDYEAVSKKTAAIELEDENWRFHGVADTAMYAQYASGLSAHEGLHSLYFDDGDHRWISNEYYGLENHGLAYLDDIPSPPDLAPYATKSALQSVSNILEDTRTESALVYRLYSGSNVVAEVTNYNSAVHAPELRLMQLNESNEYFTVWAETKGLTRTLNAAKQYTDGAIDALPATFAPRAWSRTTSGLGADAPSNTTWISTPRTVIAGGFEYAKIVDTYGEVWVLTSNGMGMEFNPDTNAYFRISADDGTPVFSIEKSDAQVVGAYADGITAGAGTVTIPVGVVSAEHPTMYWRQTLDSGEWADESSPPSGAAVAWTGEAGAWVCTVTWSGVPRPSSMFFKFTFLQEGSVVIRNNATTDLSTGIYVNGVKFVPSVSGNNLIWTKQ